MDLESLAVWTSKYLNAKQAASKRGFMKDGAKARLKALQTTAASARKGVERRGREKTDAGKER